MRTLLLGMGNPILADDSVGVRLAAYLKGRLGDRRDLTLVEECSVGGLNILEVVEGYDRVIVVDSIRTGAASPGHWCRFDGRALKETMNLNNVHDANFATALELGRRLGMKIPDDAAIHVFAIEIEDNTSFSTDLSSGVAAAFAECAEEIGREVEELLQ